MTPKSFFLVLGNLDLDHLGPVKHEATDQTLPNELNQLRIRIWEWLLTFITWCWSNESIWNKLAHYKTQFKRLLVLLTCEICTLIGCNDILTHIKTHTQAFLGLYSFWYFDIFSYYILFLNILKCYFINFFHSSLLIYAYASLQK